MSNSRPAHHGANKYRVLLSPYPSFVTSGLSAHSEQFLQLGNDGLIYLDGQFVGEGAESGGEGHGDAHYFWANDKLRSLLNEGRGTYGISSIELEGRDECRYLFVPDGGSFAVPQRSMLSISGRLCVSSTFVHPFYDGLTDEERHKAWSLGLSEVNMIERAVLHVAGAAEGDIPRGGEWCTSDGIKIRFHENFGVYNGVPQSSVYVDIAFPAPIRLERSLGYCRAAGMVTGAFASETPDIVDLSLISSSRAVYQVHSKDIIESVRADGVLPGYSGSLGDWSTGDASTFGVFLCGLIGTFPVQQLLFATRDPSGAAGQLSLIAASWEALVDRISSEDLDELVSAYGPDEGEWKQGAYSSVVNSKTLKRVAAIMHSKFKVSASKSALSWGSMCVSISLDEPILMFKCLASIWGTVNKIKHDNLYEYPGQSQSELVDNKPYIDLYDPVQVAAAVAFGWRVIIELMGYVYGDDDGLVFGAEYFEDSDWEAVFGVSVGELADSMNHFWSMQVQATPGSAPVDHRKVQMDAERASFIHRAKDMEPFLRRV
ncbi:hypothetical protein [Corynebacterium xerosis]|uniref:hypothetical protein n=1 Tax=Corynebacterium xerosis TaxID=1725 RepID=UPI003879E82D